jgi:hypothetical protein
VDITHAPSLPDRRQGRKAAAMKKGGPSPSRPLINSDAPRRQLS